mgnify:CR=1 FL=1
MNPYGPSLIEPGGLSTIETQPFPETPSIFSGPDGLKEKNRKEGQGKEKENNAIKEIHFLIDSRPEIREFGFNLQLKSGVRGLVSEVSFLSESSDLPSR